MKQQKKLLKYPPQTNAQSNQNFKSGKTNSGWYYFVNDGFNRKVLILIFKAITVSHGKNANIYKAM